jgi:hypothetical protein
MIEAKAFIPKGSHVMKQGDLFKIGRKTGREISRYFILRDNALFIYKGRDKVFPSSVISLKGMYVSSIRSENLINSNTNFQIKISDDSRSSNPIILNHRNQDIVHDWTRAL